MSDIFNFIGINFTEFETGTYESTVIWLIDGTKKEFATGDPEKDFKDALEFALESNDVITVYSSSVDSFLMDDGNYKYSEDGMVVHI